MVCCWQASSDAASRACEGGTDLTGALLFLPLADSVEQLQSVHCANTAYNTPSAPYPQLLLFGGFKNTSEIVGQFSREGQHMTEIQALRR